MILENQAALLLALFYNVISFVLATYRRMSVCLGSRRYRLDQTTYLRGKKMNEVVGDER